MIRDVYYVEWIVCDLGCTVKLDLTSMLDEMTLKYTYLSENIKMLTNPCLQLV